MIRLLSLVLILGCISPVIAQTDPFARGREFFGKQEWSAAAEQFERATAANPQNGQAWFWSGLSLYQQGKDTEAKRSLMKAEELGTFTGFTRFAIARCEARMKNADAAFAWLDKALAAGFNSLSRFESDSAMGLMKHDVRYGSIRERIDRAVRPAEYDPRFRQLDFWIGDWEVFDTAGTLQGVNSITKEQGGAVLVERWTNALGVGGMSINYFDPGSGTFKQQWVSQSGYNTSYEGNLVGTSMVMIGQNANLDGTTNLNRMTFTPNDNGTVTQFIESSNDNGKTWTPSFTGIYRRKK